MILRVKASLFAWVNLLNLWVIQQWFAFTTNQRSHDFSDKLMSDFEVWEENQTMTIVHGG